MAQSWFIVGCYSRFVTLQRWCISLKLFVSYCQPGYVRLAGLHEVRENFFGLVGRIEAVTDWFSGRLDCWFLTQRRFSIVDR